MGSDIPEFKPLFGQLFSYLLYISPILVRAYQERFTVEFVSRLTKLGVSQIARTEKIVDWNQIIFEKVGLSRFGDKFKQKKITAYDLRGLNQVIFYEGKERRIYLDCNFYKSQVSSFLFHRVLGMFWEIKLNYLVLLSLEPKTYVAPILKYIRKTVDLQSSTKIGNLLKIDRSVLSDSIARLDKAKLEDYVRKLGDIRDEDLYALWKSMRLYVRVQNILETLDIIGSFEAITSRDFIQSPLKPGQVFSLFSDSNFLFQLISKINVRG